MSPTTYIAAAYLIIGVALFVGLLLPRLTDKRAVSAPIVLLSIGLLAGLAAAPSLPSWIDAVIGTGFLGGYSTFSTACQEAARLLLDGRGGAALMHALAMTAGTLLAAVVGMEVGMALGSTPA